MDTAMRLEKVKVIFPTALNIVDNDRILKPSECKENYNTVRGDNGSIKAHPQWSGIEFTNKVEIINYIYYEPLKYRPQFILFVNDGSAYYLARLYLEETTMTRLQIAGSDNVLSKHIIPQFVNYKDHVYFFFGSYYQSGVKNLLKYDGNAVVVTDLPAARLGCSFRGRLWMIFINGSAPGVLKFTDIGDEIVGPTSFYQVGNIAEEPTSLVAREDRLMISKGLFETHELVYTTAHREDAILRMASERAGCYSHKTAATHQKTLFFYNTTGAFLMNPEQVQINPDRALEVSPGVYKISKPIQTLFDDIVSPEAPEAVFNRDAGEFEYADYYQYQGVTDGSIELPYMSGTDGYAIFQFRRPTGKCWSFIHAFGRKLGGYGADVIYAKMFVSDDMSTWIELEPAEEDDPDVSYWRVNLTWDIDIFHHLRDSNVLYIKVELHRPYYNWVSPYVNSLHVKASKVMPFMGSGYYNNGFYVFAETRDGERLNLVYRNGEWHRFENDTMEIYNLMQEIEWSSTQKIVGCGYSKSTGKGQLITRAIPESYTGDMTVICETGKNDHNMPEIPQKIRKIFMTYKGCDGKTIYLKVYGENYNKTFSINGSEDFTIKELNLGSPRSKYFSYRIEADYGDFELKDFEVWLKLLKANEK